MALLHRSPDRSSHRPARRTKVGLALLAGVLAIAPAACGDGDETGGGSGSGDGSGGGMSIVAGFYPLAHVAEQVGGEHVEVTNLTNPGTAAHDLELSPRAVGALTDADLALHLSGFQPAVDEAIDQAGTLAIDAADHVDLIPFALTDLDDHGHEDEAGDDHGHEDEAGDDHGHEAGDGDEDAHEEDDGDDHGHDHTPQEGDLDPHFWLDPARLALLGQQVAADLAALDPDNAADYRANADRFAGELGELDEELAAGLAECQDRHLVTSHAAFGYFADRYDFEAVSIAGLSPSNEPSPGALADLADFIAANDISTIYFETLVDSAVATTLADEVGAATAVLDPLEGITADSPGDDYTSVMRANLDAVRDGQPCV